MTTVSQSGLFTLQAFTSTGAMMAGGRLYFYVAGTTTKKDVYTDAAGSVPHTLTSDGVGGEYLALDARGEAPAPLYLTSGAYDVTLKTAAGATVWTRQADPVGADLAASTGSASIGFLQAGSGAVATTVQAKLRESVSITDFGAVGDGTTDDTAAINAAIAALPAYGGTIEVGYGSFLHTSTITVGKRVLFVGQGTAIVNGRSASEFLKSSSISGNGFNLAADGITIEGVAFRGQVGNGGDGVVFKAGRITMRDCAVYAMGNDGIRIGTDAGGENCNLWYMERVKSKNNGHDGILISEGAGALADANGGTMVHADLQSNASTGLNVANAQLNTFIGVTSQTNGEYGVKLGQHANYNVFFGGDWEGNTTADLRLDSGAANNSIHNFTLTISQVSHSAGSGANRIELVDANYLRGGLAFPAPQIASSDVNTLDDYQEDNFATTVGIIGLSSAGSPTWVSRIATSTKVGNIVHVNMVLAWSAHTGTGNMRITGLPFASGSIGRVAIPIVCDGFTFGSGIPMAFLENSTDYLDLFLVASGSAVSAIAMDTAGTLYLNFSYRV